MIGAATPAMASPEVFQERLVKTEQQDARSCRFPPVDTRRASVGQPALCVRRIGRRLAPPEPVDDDLSRRRQPATQQEQHSQRTRQPTSHGYQPAGDAHLQRSKNRELHCGQRTVAERTKAATKSRARAHRPTPPLLLGSRWCPEAPRVIDGHGWTRQRHRAIGVLHICSTGTDESRSGVGGVDLPEALRVTAGGVTRMTQIRYGWRGTVCRAA
jgi:hypothetical protein